jgi:hypothetical protein
MQRPEQKLTTISTASRRSMVPEIFNRHKTEIVLVVVLLCVVENPKMETRIPIKRKLDMTNASQSVWLVRIPQAVFNKWDECQPGETLGTLNISTVVEQDKTVPRLTVKLKEDENIKLEDIVVADEYTMDEAAPASSNSIALDYDEDKERFSLKGRISKRYSLKAKQTEKYQQIIRNRTSAAHQVKQAKRVDNAQTMMSAFEPKNVEFIPPAYVDDRKKNSESNGGGKRAKGSVDPGEIRQGVIAAFGKREHLTFKEIKTFCRSAPESDLRDLLKQYCTFQSKGPLKNYYSLKPEYRSNTSAAAASAGGGGEA